MTFKRELDLKNFTVIGIGGITKPAHFDNYLKIGVNAVQTAAGALSYPYLDSKKIVEGNPRVKILLDNSSSMKIFNTSFVDGLKNKISEEIPVDFGMIATGESSPLGEGLISNIRKDDNLLLITDGNSNKGIALAQLGGMHRCRRCLGAGRETKT